jgi:internalin A
MYFTDITPLARLLGLQELDLSETSVTDLAPLASLTNLRDLNLLETSVTDLAPLAGLTRLQNLDLWGGGVRDLAPLAGLKKLQKLGLLEIKARDLTPLTGMTALQDLYLSGELVRDLAPLVGLIGLQNLILAGTRVRDLTPLARLQALKTLELPETRVNDLTPLAGLKKLRTLDLSGTSVRNLTPLAGLKGLHTLSLSTTSVKNLIPLAGLKELQTLDLAGTGVTDLAPLGELTGLRTLNLSFCPVAIPKQLLRVLSERLTNLRADSAVGVPREVLSHDLSDNCLPRLRAYFSELDLAAEEETEVKVILLGNGRVGKTQLCRRFRGQLFDESVPSTHGVQIWRKELRLRIGTEQQVFQVNWWDFGGQDIYHGTHALFLRNRAVFLILWAPHLENRDEDEENGIPLRNQPLAYWLDYVRTLSGGDSPVVVIQSQCDQFADRRPDPQRSEGFGFFECCFYSAKKEVGREALEAHIRDAIRYLFERNGTLQIGSGRVKVRRRLYDWRARDQKLKPGRRRHRTLSIEEFRSVCTKAGGIFSWEHCLDYLHQTGVVFYDANLFSDRIVLDQDWALDAVYAVFHRGQTVPWLRDSGRFTREDLAATVWQEHSIDEQKLFLGVMKSCGICFT